MMVHTPTDGGGGDNMTAWIALVAFVTVVAMLAALHSRRTRGRACCAPADPAADLRMRDVLNDHPSSAKGTLKD